MSAAVQNPSFKMLDNFGKSAIFSIEGKRPLLPASEWFCMRRVFCWSLTIVCLLSGLAVAGSDVPHFINFQGRLDDTTGNTVADGAYTLTFRFFDTPTAGQLFWQETQSITTTRGVFSVLLGAVDTIPAFVFNYDSCFLEIEPQGSAPVTPRARITSVGYAFRAHTSDLLSGISLNEVDGVALQGNIDTKIAAHTAIPDAHHSKTTSASELISGTLAKERLPKDAIDSSNLATDAVTAAKILDEPGISHSYTSLTTLPVSVRVIDSTMVVVPTWGYVLVLASGWFYNNHVAGLEVHATLSISGSRTLHEEAYAAKFDIRPTAPELHTTENFMIQRVLTVGPGQLKLFLLGNQAALGTPVTVNDVQLNTLFFPTSYGEIDVAKNK